MLRHVVSKCSAPPEPIDGFDFEPSEIILFTPFITALGGVERLLLGLSDTLHSVGRRHRIVCFQDTIDLSSHASWPVRTQQLRPSRSPWAEARALQKFLVAAERAGAASPLLFDIRSAFYAGLANLPPFVLHLTDPPSMLPTDASKKSFSARRQYLPFAALPRASAGQMIHGEVVHQLNRRGARRARCVVSMTHRIAGELKQLYGVEGEIIRPGVPPASGRLLQEVDGSLRFLTVSRLETSKRVDWILEALHRLETAAPPLSKQIDWQLHIAGKGSQRQKLEDMASSRGLGSRVFFHGLVTDPQLEQLYADANLFLMPAKQGYGLPALEALARRIPVILHCESGVAEILQHTAWAEIIESGVDDLARALSIMVDRLRSGAIRAEPRPLVPTVRLWSLEIAEACGWNLPDAPHAKVL